MVLFAGLNTMKLILILSALISTSLYSQNYNYAIETKHNSNTNEEEILSQKIILPKNFNWINIPLDYKNSVWVVEHEFDLSGQTIIIPENVTIEFNGGKIIDGTIKGDDTLIMTRVDSHVFDNISLKGSFENEYLKPSWFGAKMDGIKDDRHPFITTLQQANNISAKILIENKIFLDVEETGTKSIFLPDNAWIEGTNNGQIIINNILSPAFYIALTKNITIKNIEIVYDQKYNASYGEDSPNFTANFTKNDQQLRNYLQDFHGINFNGNFPMDKGFVSFYAIFLIEAGQDILFDNVHFKAKGSTADTFIPMAIKMKEQYSKNQSISKGTSNTMIPRNINLKNVKIDGSIMGIQGIVDGFNCSGLISYRYSDFQGPNGSYLGGFDGTNYDFPPPHLIYLNHDLSKAHKSRNIVIDNTLDYGDYVGTSKVRGKTGINIGYCNSLKIVDDINDVTVDGYKSYRRDGFADLGSLTNANFKNIYAEYNSSIFSPDQRYITFRFLGSLNNVTFKNITIKDLAPVTQVHPMNSIEGDYITMENVNFFLRELNSKEDGPFAIFGSNNRVTGCSLNIEKHTSTLDDMGVVYLNEDTRNNGQNNYYDVSVKGWRDISKRTLSRAVKLTFQNPSNNNSNYAKVKDINNNYSVEVKNGKKTINWIISETIQLGNGKTQALEMEIPYNFTITKIMVKIIENLATNVSLGTNTTTYKSNILPILPKTVGSLTKNLDLEPSLIDKSLYLSGETSFQNQGKLEITVDLVRKY